VGTRLCPRQVLPPCPDKGEDYRNEPLSCSPLSSSLKPRCEDGMGWPWQELQSLKAAHRPPCQAPLPVTTNTQVQSLAQALPRPPCLCPASLASPHLSIRSSHHSPKVSVDSTFMVLGTLLHQLCSYRKVHFPQVHKNERKKVSETWIQRPEGWHV
jgi:hypothetical protein